MAIKASHQFFGVLTLAFAGAAVMVHQNPEPESKPLDYNLLETALEVSYQNSTCGKVEETKDIESCMVYLDKMATGFVQQVHTFSGLKAKRGNAEDQALQKHWVAYACQVTPPETLPEFSERVAPCLDAAVKVAHHFKIPEAAGFERIADVLKRQMESAAKQAPHKTMVMI